MPPPGNQVGFLGLGTDFPSVYLGLKGQTGSILALKLLKDMSSFDRSKPTAKKNLVPLCKTHA